jgi:cytochrome d ubiquinol oxidase subunit II
METLWLCLITAMLITYVVLDGFDLGAGIVHLYVARSEDERRLVLRSIGPVWDGNEVWLIAAAGTLFLAFPALYAASFSGFYLPLMIVLWLLILRGIALEFRSHVDSAAWRPLWDVVFSISGALLAVFLGAALGCVVRGVPLDRSGFFFEPLWTDFRLGPETGILDWYTSLVGILALLALTQHGANWVALKTEAGLRDRARHVAARIWWGVAALTIVVTIATFTIQPHVPRRLGDQAWGYLFPAIAVGGLLAGSRLQRLSRLLRLPDRDARQRRLRPLSICSAFQHRPFAEPHRPQLRRPRLRSAGGTGVVGSRHAAGDRLHGVRLSSFPGKGDARAGRILAPDTVSSRPAPEDRRLQSL